MPRRVLLSKVADWAFERVGAALMEGVPGGCDTLPRWSNRIDTSEEGGEKCPKDCCIVAPAARSMPRS